MGNTEQSGFVPEQEQNPAELAMKKWGVDLTDDHAVLSKLQSMGGKMPDVADLSNLWRDLQKQKNQEEEFKQAA